MLAIPLKGLVEQERTCEPVSESHIPGSREKYRENREIGAGNRRGMSMTCSVYGLKSLSRHEK